MKIARPEWGSLIWKTDALPVASQMHHDAPAVPIKFVRIADDGELSTAICLNASPVPMFRAWLITDSPESACRTLRLREAIPDNRIDGIGMMTVTETAVGPLAEWARAKSIEGLIWAGLPARMADVKGQIPMLEEARYYLQNLTGETREHACHYIEQIPAQIGTAYRRAFAGLTLWQSDSSTVERYQAACLLLRICLLFLTIISCSYEAPHHLRTKLWLCLQKRFINRSGFKWLINVCNHIMTTPPRLARL